MVVVAIDFGTTNSYIVRCPEEARSPLPLQLSASHVGIETTLLYSNEIESPYIDENATRTFASAEIHERQKYDYRFYSHFKPDIEHSENARRCATDFLRAIKRDAARAHLPLLPEKSRVIFGMPSKSSENYRQTLREIARKADYGEIELIDEPIGALWDAINANTAPLSAILSGLLVIDFGGGTCDFAFLRNGKIEHSWGDAELGGRLFDDLFYQWFIAMRGDDAAAIEDEFIQKGDQLILLTYHCRELKEKFSEYMLSQSRKPFSWTLGKYGTASGLTWDEFLRRAQNYSPSVTLKKFWREQDRKIPQKLTNGAIGLTTWFTDTLLAGLRQSRIPCTDIQVIALAGGSSQWKFVADFCAENFRNGKLVRSGQPYAAVATGLAIYPALQKELEHKRARLTEKKTQFLPDTRAELDAAFTRTAKEIAETITAEFFDPEIAPRLRNFRKNSGRLRDLENAIAASAETFFVNRVKIEEIIRQPVQRNLRSFSFIVHNKIRGFLSAEGLLLADDAPENSTAPESNIEISPVGVAEEIAGKINLLVGGIITILVANLCGGGGIALLHTGLVGWILGGLAAAATLLFSAKALKDRMKNWIKEREIPRMLLHATPLIDLNPLTRALSDEKITEYREKTRHEIERQIASLLVNPAKEIMTYAEKLLDAEIDRLSIANLK